MRLIYAYFMRMVEVLLPLWPLRGEKFNQWLIGQKQVWQDLENLPKSGELKKIWIHCASVGEFEQAKPVITRIKKQYQDVFIAVTFFSSSGYFAKRSDTTIDWVSYLPFDTTNNAKRFLSALQPNIALFVKYELWFNFFHELKISNIPSAIFSAHFTDKHWSTQWPGIHLGRHLKDLDVIFTQSEASCNRLVSVGICNGIAVGDTRVDQVLMTKATEYHNELLVKFLAGKRTLVIGSNWPEDDQYLFEVLKKFQNHKVIVVPHELGDEQLHRWLRNFRDRIITIDELEFVKESNATMLYVNRIGLLSKLYRFADLAYVGGGFGKSVHNTLEPLVYGVPVVFGPQNARFLEVQLFKKLGIGIEVTDADTMMEAFQKGLENQDFRHEVGLKINAYIQEQQGASEKVASWVLKQLN